MKIEKGIAGNKQNDSFIKGLDLELYTSCTDYTVSRETFELFLDKQYDLLVTLPQPSSEELPSYYESEDYISHTDSKRSFMDKLYQLIKRFSLTKKLKLINQLSGKKGKLLDIGCGTGDLLAVCEEDGWDVSGVEPSEKARKFAVGKLHTGMEIQTDLNELKETHKDYYDVITMWHVLEHIPNLIEYIETLKILLKKDGHLIIAVPNFKSYDAKHYKKFWAAFDVPRHLWHFSQRSVSTIFQHFDFRVVATKPLIFDSFYVSLLSEKYKTGRSNVIGAFKTGLLSNMKAKQTGEYSSLIYVVKNR